MANSLRRIKSAHKDAEKSARLDAFAVGQKSELIPIGSAPILTRNTKIEQTWMALLSDPPISHSDPNQWRKAADVRPSSFPFCPRRYVMERLGLVMESTFDVGACFYTEIGKAVHYVAQNALARTGRLWGFWKCARPGCGEQWSEDPSFFPEYEECRACRSPKFEYHEMRLTDERIHLAGHTDGVLVFKKHSSLLEIKSAGDDKVRALQQMSATDLVTLFQSEAPWYGYWHQASTYASLIREKYGREIPPVTRVDYMIFSRDSPKVMAAISLEVPSDNSWWAEIRARIVMAQKARKLQVLPVGFAKTTADIAALPPCKYCSHKDVCLQPQGHLRFTSDALYDNDSKQTLDGVLNQERAKWAESFVATLSNQQT